MTSLSRHHRVRAMRADVVEGPQRPGVITDDEPAPTEELERDIVARSGELADVTDDLP